MANIVVEFYDGTLAAVQLLAKPGRTAAKVQNACAKRFQTGVGTLSPKDNPNLLLEEEDAVPGGVTYIFTPFAGSQDVNQGETLQDYLPAAFNALECIAVKRALKSPGKHST